MTRPPAPSRRSQGRSSGGSAGARRSPPTILLGRDPVLGRAPEVARGARSVPDLLIEPGGLLVGAGRAFMTFDRVHQRALGEGRLTVGAARCLPQRLCPSPKLASA